MFSAWLRPFLMIRLSTTTGAERANRDAVGRLRPVGQGNSTAQRDSGNEVTAGNRGGRGSDLIKRRSWVLP